jgi:magnesium transporter
MLTFHPSGQVHNIGPAPEGSVWVDLFNPTEVETQVVAGHTGLALPNLADLSRIDRSSQLSLDGEVLRVAAPVVAGSDTDHPSLSYIGLILTPKVLITIRFTELKMIETTVARACAGPGPVSSVAVFVALLEALIDRESDLLEAARAYLEEISHRVFRTAPDGVKAAVHSSAALRATLQKLGRIGDRLSMIRESLMSVGRVAPFAAELASDWIPPADQARLKAINQDVESLNLFVEHLVGKVQFLLDAVVGLIGIEQNDIFKTLTIWSLVGIPPTLVAGIYGMNFHNMPEYDWRYGYQWGLGLIVVTTVAPLIWFKWKKWF